MEVLIPFAVIDVGDAVICEVAVDTTPTVNVTVALSVMELPFSVPVIVAVPVTVDEVNVAVYVPLLLSVTEPSVPDVVESATVSPPVDRLFPFTSFNCTVMVDVLVPFAVIDVGEAVINDVAVEAVPTVNVTVALSVMELPFNVPVIVAVPVTVDEVNVAVYVPLLLSVTEPSVPDVVERATVSPPLVRLFPFTSFNCKVIVDVLIPFAVIEAGDAVINEVAVEAAPTVNVTVALSVMELPFNVPVIVAVPVTVDEVNVAV